MISLIQRVSHANVVVNNEVTGQINQGILALVAIEKNDSQQSADKLLKRLLAYRIFTDHNDKMNLSLHDISGGLLLIPQFTLAADTHKGLRPSFAPAASPESSRSLFNYLLKQAQAIHRDTASGIFGADMQVSLTNDGPVTFWLQVK